MRGKVKVKPSGIYGRFGRSPASTEWGCDPTRDATSTLHMECAFPIDVVKHQAHSSNSSMANNDRHSPRQGYCSQCLRQKHHLSLASRLPANSGARRALDPVATAQPWCVHGALTCVKHSLSTKRPRRQKRVTTTTTTVTTIPPTVVLPIGIVWMLLRDALSRRPRDATDLPCTTGASTLVPSAMATVLRGRSCLGSH